MNLGIFRARVRMIPSELMKMKNDSGIRFALANRKAKDR